MWTMMDAPSDRDYAEQQCPYGPEDEDPDNVVPSAPPKEETNDDENCPF